jgi:hypothetical protein
LIIVVDGQSDQANNCFVIADPQFLEALFVKYVALEESFGVVLRSKLLQGSIFSSVSLVIKVQLIQDDLALNL